MDVAVAAALGFLAGSIPTAYIVARFLKGVDIRTVGSGNVGGTNVGMHVGKLAYAAVLLYDLVKGALVVAVLEAQGYSLVARLAAGIAAVAGHNWTPWLGFLGGRGIATTGGVLFMFGPLETLATGVILVIGSLAFNRGATTTVLVFACWPLMAWWLGRAPQVVLAGIVIWLLIVARRLMGSPGVSAAPPGESVYWNRFWLDRDIRDEAAWVKQGGNRK